MFLKYCTFGIERPALYLFDSVSYFCVKLSVNSSIFVAKISAQCRNNMFFKSSFTFEGLGNVYGEIAGFVPSGEYPWSKHT